MIDLSLEEWTEDDIRYISRSISSVNVMPLKKTVPDFLADEPERVEGPELMQLLAAMALRAAKDRDDFREQQAVALEWLAPLVARKLWIDGEDRARLASYREDLSEGESRPVGWGNAKEHLAVEGIHLALDYADHPQQIRFKNDHVHESADDKSPPDLVPSRLPVVLYMRWLLRKAVVAARCILRDEPFPPRDIELVELDVDSLSSDERDLLELLAQRGEAEQLILEALSVATPEQRRILHTRLAMGGDASWAEVGRALGKSKNNVKVQMSKLRKQLRRSSLDDL